jgi:NAD(P)-dependent dehydrogenase (short-subunit alcohol dehydrogenase family)
VTQSADMKAHPFGLKGKVAVVTGAGRGLGRAVALGLAAAGAELVIASRQVAHLKDTADTIERMNGTVHMLSVDITDPEACQALMAKAQSLAGRIDILVCNAATNIQGPAARMDVLDWRRVMDTELSGYFYLSRAVYPHMERAGGSIIFISANSSKVGYSDLVGVSTAKGGLDMMARNLAVEWGAQNIRVNTINPGWTEHVPEDGADVSAGDGDLEDDIRATTPLQRRGKMPEFGHAAVFLASEASSYITGHNLVVDGGYSVK